MSYYNWYTILTGRNGAGADTLFHIGHNGAHLQSDQYIEHQVEQFGTLSQHCFGSGQLFGDAQITSTNIVLINETGALDSMHSLSFSRGASVLFALDPVTATGFPSASGNYGRQCTVWAEQPVVEERTVNFAARSHISVLDKPFVTTKYAGNNAGAPLAGIEGTAADLKGKEKPCVIGQVYNATPKLVNTDKWIYQADGVRGFIGAYTLTVYDQLAATIVRGADYVSQADMEANAPLAGQYRVWPAGGCWRHGSLPAGAVTYDLNNPPQVGQASTIQYVVNVLGNKYLPSAAENGINDVTSALVTDHECGIVIDTPMTRLQALNLVLRSVSAFIFFEANEQPVIQQIYDPTTTWPLFPPPGSTPPYKSGLDPLALDESSIIPGSLKQFIPGDGGYGLPVWRVNVHYKKNWTVMSASEVAGAALASVSFAEREYRTVFASDSTIKDQWPLAQEVNIYTLLTEEADAQAEANRLFALFRVRRQGFSLTVKGEVVRRHPQFDGVSYDSTDFHVGGRVYITLDRFGWNAGKTFLVIGIDRNVEADTYALKVWG